MKHLLLLFTLIPFLTSAQFKADTINKTIEFSQVYTVDGLSKETIRQKVKEWTALNFKDSEQVIKLDTQEKVIVKGNFNVESTYNNYTANLPCFFDMITAFKDGKYKLIINELYIRTQAMDIPASDYLVGSIDNYKNHLIQKVESEPNSSTSKYYKKAIENESRLKKYYKIQKKNSLQFIPQFQKNLERISTDLFKYINKKPDTEW